MRVSTRSTMAACVICSCVLLFIPSARADSTPGATSTKDTNKDHHDRLPSVASIAQRLQAHHDQDQRRATSEGAAEDTDASHDRFYDATSWSDDDKLTLQRLLRQMGKLLPHVDLDTLHARYQEAAANIGDHQRRPPRRRLTEVVNTADIGGDRSLRKRGTRKSTAKSKSKKNSRKTKDKWDDEATVYWGSKSSDDSDSDSNDDSGDDFYAMAKKNKKKRSSDDDSRQSRKNSRTKKKRSSDDESRKSRKQSHKVNDHDFSDSGDTIPRQKKKDAGSNNKKTVKSSFQPHFGPSFRDSRDEVDLFHGIVKKKQKKSDGRKKSSHKKDHRRLGGDKSSKSSRSGSSSDSSFEPTFEPTYEPTYEDSLEECPKYFYYDSDDGHYYPDVEYYESESKKSSKASKGSADSTSISDDSSSAKSSKRTIRHRHLKSSSEYADSATESSKKSKSGKSSKSSKGSSSSYDFAPCYPPRGHSTDGFEEYVPLRGDCADEGDRAGNGVPCPSVDLRRICDKYDNKGSFRKCLDACEPSFCCIHDALSPPAPNSNYLAPNCNEDVNCAQYSYCYIAWWKLADTIGPAIYLKVEQDDDFYDISADELEGDQTDYDFFQQFSLHHWDDIDTIVAAGTDSNGDFKTSTIFNDPDYWDTDI